MSSDKPAPAGAPCTGEGPDRPVETDPRSESELLFRQHNEALLSYAYARVRSWADAKDVVQEAYVKVFGLGKNKPISHLRAYLYKAVRNSATDWVRRRHVRESFADLEYFRVEREAYSAEQLWLLREEIQRAFDALPPKCRLAMMLVNVRGLSCEEAAECMHIKTASVRRLLERGVEHLLSTLPAESEQGGSKR